jgi:hypothetical protein
LTIKVVGEWLDLHKLKNTYLAKKPVLKIVSRNAQLVPLAPAPHAHNADHKSSGVMEKDMHHLEMKSKGGFAETADSDFQTLEMFRGLGARLNVLKELIRSH